MTNYNNNNNNDFTKAQMHTALSIEKQSALNECIKFIFDVCNGLITEISDKTIDDALDCKNNLDKAIIYASDLQHDEKEKQIHQAELNMETSKQMFKSFINFMEVKYKHQQNNNL